MQLCLVVTRDELSALARELVPSRFDISRKPRRAVSLTRPIALELVPDVGLRVRGDARIAWEVAGLTVQVGVRAWQVLLEPSVASRNGLPALSFDPVLEHLDLENVPGFLDERIVLGINEAFTAQKRKLAYKLGEKFGASRVLPAKLSPGGCFRFVPEEASVEVTREQIRFALTLAPKLERDRREPRPELPPPSRRSSPAAPPGSPSSRSARA